MELTPGKLYKLEQDIPVYFNEDYLRLHSIEKNSIILRIYDKKQNLFGTRETLLR